MKLKIINETQYDGRVLNGIVRWVFRYLDLKGDRVVVKVKHHSGSHAYQGRFYAHARHHGGYVRNGWGEWQDVSPQMPNGYDHLIVCRIGKPGVYPRTTHVYDRRDSPGTWQVADWREALVSITAHEAMHLKQYLKPRRNHRGRFNEVETEWAAYRLWREWKEERV